MQRNLFQTASAIRPFHCLKPIQNVFGHSSASSEGTCGRWRIWAPSNRHCLSQRVLDLFLQFPCCFRVLVFEEKILVWYNKMIKKIMWPAPKHFPLRCCFCFGGISAISWSHPNSIPIWAAWFLSNRMLRFLQVWTSLATSVWGLRDKHCWMTCISLPTNIARCG